MFTRAIGSANMSVIQLGAGDAGAAVDVLCDAFDGYPALRFILGERGNADDRLRKLIGFFVAARALRDEPILAVEEEGSVVGVALVTLPGVRPPSPELDARRAALWQEIGAEERTRYEALSAATKPLLPSPPHHHLNMIGVRRSHVGRGHARPLLEAVHDLAESDPTSTGVSLNTEVEENVSLYRRFGYGVLGQRRLADHLQTWVMFRPR